MRRIEMLSLLSALVLPVVTLGAQHDPASPQDRPASVMEFDHQIEDLVVLRNELRTLVAEWDSVLATTPAGKAAHLLDTLGTRGAVEVAVRKRKSRVDGM